MPVSERFKEKTRKKVETWKAKVLGKHFPRGDFEEVELERLRIVHQLTHRTSTSLPTGLMRLYLIWIPRLPDPQLALLT